MPTATVHPEAEPPFTAQVVELRPNCILLRSERSLAFRSKVLVEVVGARLRGEIVHANAGHLAVTFPVAVEIFDVIEAVDAALNEAPSASIDPPPAIMAAIDKALELDPPSDLAMLEDPEVPTSTVDLPDEPAPRSPAALREAPHLVIRDGRIETDDTAGMLGLCLLLHSGRSVAAIGEGWLPPTVHLAVPESPFVVDAERLFDGWASLKARDRGELHRAIRTLRPALDSLESPPGGAAVGSALPRPASASGAPPPAEDLPPPSPNPNRRFESETTVVEPPPKDAPVTKRYPVLDADERTVRFASHAQFVAQYTENLSKQALVVDMPPVPRSTTRAFVLAVPGTGSVEVLARAVLPRDGEVGFALERFGSIRGPLQALARGTLPALPVERRIEPAPADIDRYDGPLAPPEDPRALMQLRARRPGSLANIAGSYLGTLEFVFGRHLDCVVEVRAPPVVVRAWVQAGRVVFATHEPEETDGRLGRRLLASRAISPRDLQNALDAARTSGQALGVLLIEHGSLRREDLNRILRAQTVDRITAPVRFRAGTLRVQPWYTPPVQARWFPVSGDALLAAAIRERLRRIPAGELESSLSGDLDRDVIVDLSAIEPRYRIRKKEHRVYASAATTALPLRRVCRFVSDGPAESLRLVVLGTALGFVRLRERQSEEATAAAARPARSTAGLEQRLEQLEAADHFDALGVHWAAPHHEIIVAYKREIHLLDRMPRPPDARARELARRLRDRIELAFKKIGNRGHRIAYRTRVIPADQLERAGEHLLDQAEQAVARERPDDADGYLDTAEELLGPRAVRRLREAVRELRVGF